MTTRTTRPITIAATKTTGSARRPSRRAEALRSRDGTAGRTVGALLRLLLLFDLRGEEQGGV
jgi:hypothetical protein